MFDADAESAWLEAIQEIVDGNFGRHDVRREAVRLLEHPAGAVAAISLIVDASAAASEGMRTLAELIDDEEGLEDPRVEAAAQLLEEFLKQTRHVSRMGHSGGAAVRKAIEGTIDDFQPLDVAARMRLAGIYVGAGLPVPESLILPPEMIGTLVPGGPGEEGPSADALAAVLAELDEAAEIEPFDAYVELRRNMAAAPDAIVALLAQAAGTAASPAVARFAAYFLLERNPEIRRAAAGGLRARAEGPGLEPALAAALTRMRPWINDEAVLADLASALRVGRIRADGPQAAPPARITRALACLPEPSGARQLIYAVRQDGERLLLFVVVDDEEGVIGTMVMSVADAVEERAIREDLKETLGAVEVPAAFLETEIGMAIAKAMPDRPDLLDIAELVGARFEPVSTSTEEILAPILASKAARGRPIPPRAWERAAARAPVAEWTDGGDAIPEAALLDDPVEVLAREVEHRLESRRAIWARRLAATAATLAASEAHARDAAAWMPFALDGRALLEGKPLDEIPLMRHVTAVTLAGQLVLMTSTRLEDFDLDGFDLDDLDDLDDE